MESCNKAHQYLGEPTLADAILDRLVHNAYRINLWGESMRKRSVNLTDSGAADKSANVLRRCAPALTAIPWTE